MKRDLRKKFLQFFHSNITSSVKINLSSPLSANQNKVLIELTIHITQAVQVNICEFFNSLRDHIKCNFHALAYAMPMYGGAGNK